MTDDEFMTLVSEMVIEARDEDTRSGGHFDLDGWGHYFLETWQVSPDAVTYAWQVYEHEVWGQSHAQ